MAHALIPICLKKKKKARCYGSCFNPNPWEAETAGLLRGSGKHGLHAKPDVHSEKLCQHKQAKKRKERQREREGG